MATSAKPGHALRLVGAWCSFGGWTSGGWSVSGVCSNLVLSSFTFTFGGTSSCWAGCCSTFSTTTVVWTGGSGIELLTGVGTGTTWVAGSLSPCSPPMLPLFSLEVSLISTREWNKCFPTKMISQNSELRKRMVQWCTVHMRFHLPKFLLSMLIFHPRRATEGIASEPRISTLLDWSSSADALGAVEPKWFGQSVVVFPVLSSKTC